MSHDQQPCSRRRCLLPELEDHRARSPFMGLSKNKLLIEVSRTWFSCCGGTGQQANPDGSISRCPLAKHSVQLKKVLDLYLAKWGNTQSLHGVLERADLQRLIAISNGAQIGGRLLSSRTRETPGPLWSIAVAAAWRFARSVHFVTLGDNKKDCLLPPQTLPNMVLLVENHVSPWHPETILDCEVLINYCYNTATPLWIDFVNTKNSTKPVRPATNAVLAKLHQHLARLQKVDPLRYFSSSGRWKLRAMQMISA